MGTRLGAGFGRRAGGREGRYLSSVFCRPCFFISDVFAQLGATESLQFSVEIAGRTASNDFHRIVAHVRAQPLGGLALTLACETGSECTPP
ncbi:hypothetical protein C770_GR4pC1228 (plasmid) [Sinorhizobium meliloti GR4]|nr:hypothetical protein C770_GR4pC1228 [Sinorhizobium meliloti GR4]